MKSIYFDDNVLPCSIKLTIYCNFAINQLPWQRQSTANQIKVSIQVTIYGKVTVNDNCYATGPWSPNGDCTSVRWIGFLSLKQFIIIVRIYETMDLLHDETQWLKICRAFNQSVGY